MKRTGIIFDGLKVKRENSLAAYEELKKEGVPGYIEEERGAFQWEEKEEICLDITYFLVYAMSQNAVCMKEMQNFSPEEVLRYQKLFLEKGYHGEYFLSCLGYEEYYCAQVLFGMLAEIRNGEDEKAEKTYQKLTALIRRGWKDARREVLSDKQVGFEEIQKWAQPYVMQPAMGMSQMCMLIILAELFQVKIIRNTNYFLLLECMLEKNTLWESKKEEILEFETWGKSHISHRQFLQILYRRMETPLCAVPGFREEDEEFDYYLQDLFHLGGIDRNVLAGESIDERTFQMLVELGNFEGTDSVDTYVFSLYIVLLSGYVHKCLEKIKENEPVRWMQMTEYLKEEKTVLKNKLDHVTEKYLQAQKRIRELESNLEEAGRIVRRKENQLARKENQCAAEHKELIKLREMVYEAKTPGKRKEIC